MSDKKSKNTKLAIAWMAGLGIILMAMWGANIFTDLSAFYNVVIGVSVGGLLILLSGILTYFKESKFKQINFDDVETLFLAGIGTTITISSLALIDQIRNRLPSVLINFFDGIVLYASIVGVIFLIIVFARSLKK